MLAIIGETLLVMLMSAVAFAATVWMAHHLGLMKLQGVKQFKDSHQSMVDVATSFGAIHPHLEGDADPSSARVTRAKRVNVALNIGEASKHALYMAMRDAEVFPVQSAAIAGRMTRGESQQKNTVRNLAKTEAIAA